VAAALLGSLLALECGVRLYVASKSGPRVLLHGTPWARHELGRDPGDAAGHARKAKALHTVNEPRRNTRHGYAKFFPGEHRRTYDVDTGEVFEVRINSRGFRGEDFSPAKRPGVLRVATLGSSSTFGYYDRDADTYPRRLEIALDERCPGRDVEVLNLGIPHLLSEEIAALFLEEGLAYEPDVVTFYEGNNDSLVAPPPELFPALEGGGGVSPLVSALARVSLLARYWELQAERGSRLVTSEDAIEQLARQRSAFLLHQLDRIADACAAHGILFVVANQQKKSTTWWPTSAEHRRELRRLSYGDEVAALRARAGLARGLDRFELSMLVHARMMADLEAWASRRGLPFADVITALDGRRDLLLSNVHLHAEANGMIAAVLADVIAPRACAASSAGPAGRDRRGD
jgi:lysophospholipase L1-like esterase